VSRIAIPLPKDCRLPLSVMPYLLMVFFSGCNFEVIAAILIGKVLMVFGGRLHFDFSDRSRLQDGSGNVARGLMDLD
jgi:hypothetical protein